MQKADAKRNSGSDDPVWVLLAELLLRDFLPDQDWRDKPAAGDLFQTLRELGMSPAGMDNMAKTLAGCAREAWLHYEQKGLECPGRIRIFCQKKVIDDANTVKTSRPQLTEQGKKQKRIFPDSGANTMGGWGYFSIERGGDVSTGSFLSSGNSVDVYLYREGE